ncbi:MAG: ADP-ribosylglycohydrolase family protein, partial [Clostridia bacterium]|nr:ADP-ribosylglycohydrolase family protein [Clostridia bacterium]
NIPEYWKKNLYEVEDRPFAYTDISLNKAYQLSYDQALEVISLNGGTVNEDNVEIKVQSPETVRLEQSFVGHFPVSNEWTDRKFGEVINFTGNGVVVGYHMNGKKGSEIADKEYVAEVAVNLDGQQVETVKLPVAFLKRKLDLFYKYNLEDTDHTLSFEWLNPRKDVEIGLTRILVYSGTDPRDTE